MTKTKVKDKLIGALLKNSKKRTFPFIGKIIDENFYNDNLDLKLLDLPLLNCKDKAARVSRIVEDEFNIILTISTGVLPPNKRSITDYVTLGYMVRTIHKLQ